MGIRGAIAAGVLGLALLSTPAVPVRAGLTPEALQKREQIRHAVAEGILSIYTIPFHTYVNLHMWEEIRAILRANTDNLMTRRLPGVYYSRPYVLDGRIWVFENATVSGGNIYVFDPETLSGVDRRRNERFIDYDGAIREIAGSTVISGGSDKDADAAVVWETDTDRTRVLKLVEGHYVGSIRAAGGRLFIGSCGGLVNSWTWPDLAPLGVYRSDGQRNVDWDAFNQRECITGITLLGDTLVGAGERTLFFWDLETRERVRTRPKRIPDSIPVFFKQYLVEYRNDRFCVQDLATGRRLKMVRTDRYVEDLIVTDQSVLRDHQGDVLVAALRYNKGLAFYDFPSCVPLHRIEVNGEALAAVGSTLFATDDRHLYRYHLKSRDSRRYQAFIDAIDPDKIRVDDETYPALIDLLADHPRLLAEAGVVDRYLEKKGLTLHHTFKYGKIGRRTPPEADGGGDAGGSAPAPEDVYGYKALYGMENRSDRYWLVTLSAAWRGQYGRNTRYEERVHYPKRPHVFFLAPEGGRRASFQVGEKEPDHLVIYPVRADAVSREFHQGLLTALDPENTDPAVIDRYLADERAAAFHDRLNARRKALAEEAGGGLLRRLNPFD